MRYDSLQNIKGSNRFSKDQQHFWSNDGASNFLKVFSPKNSWVAIASNYRHISRRHFSPPFLGGEKLQPEIRLRSQARDAT